MERYPSLFWSGEPAAVTISARTFADCALAPMLSTAAQDLLARPCSRDEILARQALVAQLRRDATAQFAALTEVLDALATAHHAAVNAVSEVEAMALRVALLREYLAAWPIVTAMAVEGLLGEPHRAFWPRQVEAHDALAAALPVIEAHLRGLSGVTMQVPPHEPVRLTPPQDDGSLVAFAQTAAHALALTVPDRRPLGRRLDGAFSDAWLALHDAPAEGLRRALAPFDGLPVGAMLSLRDELTVCTSICAILDRAEAAGCPVCTPTLADAPTYDADELCDLALLERGVTIVPNDVRLDAEHRFFYLTGANGGGKTTYLRALVGNLILGLGGFPVAASRAILYPWRDIATHFTADEAFTGTGRFVDEQLRADAMLARAGRDCFFAFNETFSGADHDRGLASLRDLVSALTEAGVAGLCVTHFHEVAHDGLPMLTTVVDEADGGRRTYRIVAESGCGSSFARDILRKYRLDAASLAARLSEEVSAT